MKKLSKGTVIDSDSYIITAQEKKLISVVFSYFKDILPEILANFETEEAIK